MITKIGSIRKGAVRFTFSNGNSLSCIFGPGSYTANHDIPFETRTDSFTKYDSHTVEIMVSGDARFIKWFERKYIDNPGGYITVADIPLILKQADSKIYGPQGENNG